MGRSLGYMVVPLFGGCNTLGASGWALNTKVQFFDTFVAAYRVLGIDLVKNQSTGVD